MPPKVARLVGLGAYGACAGLAVLYLLLVYVTRPSRIGGIDPTTAIVAWISLGGVFAALIGAHVVVARRLLDVARGTSRTP